LTPKNWHPENSYIPIISDTLGNWQMLEKLVRLNLTPAYTNLLEGLRHNTGGLLGFERAPAARMNHHDFEGGLVYHLLDMWDVWQWLRPITYAEGHVDDPNIIQAIINHDLHKAHRYYAQVSRSPWKTKFAKDHTGFNMPDHAKSMWILNQYGVVLSELQMNTLCWAEGGFAKEWPEWTSVLAKVAYMLDELSGNVRSRIETGDLVVAAGQKYRTEKYG